MKTASFRLLGWLTLLSSLCFVSTVSATDPRPDWWGCIGTTRRCGYPAPCGERDTLEKAVVTDLVSFSVAGEACWMYPLLRSDVTFSVRNKAVHVSGRRNVSIYLASSSNGSRLPYYHVEDATGYSLDILQEDSTLAVVINQTVSTGLRQDVWRVDFDDRHRVASIEVMVSDYASQLVISDAPVIDEGNVISCRFPVEREYQDCIGEKRECHGYAKPCKGKDGTLLKTITRYIAQRITVERRYNDTLHLVMNDSYQALPALGIDFTGPTAILSYQYSGDPIRTDPLYLVVNVSIPFLLQKDGLVVGFFDFYFYAFQKAIAFPLLSAWYVVYRPDHHLYAYIQQPDSSAVIDNLAFTQNVTIPYLCANIPLACNGVYAQYPVPSGPNQGLTCEQYLSTLGIRNSTAIGTEAGPYTDCIAYHLFLARQFPDPHCGHLSAIPALTKCK